MRPKAILLAFSAAVAWAGVPGGVVGGVARSPHPTVVRDLRAVRKGNKVTLTWSRPRDKAADPTAITICRVISASPAPSFPQADCAPIGHAGPGKSRKVGADSAVLRFIDTLDARLPQTDPPQFAIYRIEPAAAVNPAVAYSNSASVSLAPSPQVQQLHSSLDQRGVYLIWEADAEPHSGVEFDFHVWRQEKGAKAGEPVPGKRAAVHFLHSVLHQREGERWAVVDTTAESEKSYNYWLTPLVRVYSPSHELLAEFEGDDSGPLEVVVHDVFPPAMPEGLMAVSSEVPQKKFVDLLWSPNRERDLAGYNIYRREEGSKLARIGTAPADMLSYQDKDVTAGRIYFYAISAVDLHGNESGKTPETAEVKP